MKAAGERITMVTAYDFTFARLLDEAGVDMLLVGDSLGMVVQGHDTTLPVTLDEMVYHTRMVARGAAARAGRRRPAVRELPGVARAGGRERDPPGEGRRRALREARGRPRHGRDDRAHRERRHPGHGPRRPHAAVGAPDGRASRAGPPARQRAGRRERVLEDAKAVEAAGAFAVVLECIPLDLAAEITAALSIPTIGIGAGVHCDGQVLVLHDLLGLNDAWTPRFVKRYAELGREVVRGRAGVRRRGEGRRLPDARRTPSSRRWRRRAEADGDARHTPRAMQAWSDAARARRTARSRSCRRWARCTRATWRSSPRRGGAAERVVVSIFVNPTQFDRRDDFARYPRTLDADAAPCAAAGVDAVFAPTRGGDVSRKASDRTSRWRGSPSRSAARRGPATSAASRRS